MFNWTTTTLINEIPFIKKENGKLRIGKHLFEKRWVENIRKAEGHIMELCESFPSVVDVYNDTDSIKMKCSHVDYPKVLEWLDAKQWLDDKELGKFKEEDKGEVFGMKVLAAKKYVATNERGYVIPTKSGLSGLKWLDIYKKYKTMDITADMINPGDSFETRRSKEVEGGVIIEDVILKLSEFKVGRN